MGLRGERHVLGPPAITQDGPQDQSLDEEEDGDRDQEHDRVQVADVLALDGHRLRRIEAGHHALARPDQVDTGHDRDRNHPERDGADDESLERGTATSGGTRHADPQR